MFNNIIRVFIFINILGYSMCCSASELELKVEPDTVYVDLEKPVANFIITFINSNNNNYEIYRFSDYWSPVYSNKISWEKWNVGFNIAIHDSNNNFIYYSFIDEDDKLQDENYNMSSDSEKNTNKAKKKLYTVDSDLFFSELEKKAINSFKKTKKTLYANDSLKIFLNLNLKDYFLEKGEYILIVYYIQNQYVFKLFKFKETDNIPKINVQSNTIRLIVK